MKKTSKEFMEWLGLKIGDKIKVNGRYYTIEINELSGLPVYANDKKYLNIIYLLDKEIEILPQPKRVGDLKCGEYGEQNCSSCPVRAICVSDEYNDDTLYKKLELTHKYAKDQEIYEIIKARLDKEVEDNDSKSI